MTETLQMKGEIKMNIFLNSFYTLLKRARFIAGFF